mmetsp:Transcript_9066/g.17671  ORF Transcript_9066/g.17671 Transcript_9066/m.17671 type:complete len:237 (-) Transcript_9066:280-990(-)
MLKSVFHLPALLFGLVTSRRLPPLGNHGCYFLHHRPNVAPRAEVIKLLDRDEPTVVLVRLDKNPLCFLLAGGPRLLAQHFELLEAEFVLLEVHVRRLRSGLELLENQLGDFLRLVNLDVLQLFVQPPHLRPDGITGDEFPKLVSVELSALVAVRSVPKHHRLFRIASGTSAQNLEFLPRKHVILILIQEVEEFICSHQTLLFCNILLSDDHVHPGDSGIDVLPCAEEKEFVSVKVA